MMKSIAVILALAAGLFFVTVAISGGVQTENRGVAQVELNGGSKGMVAFPHHRHQDTLGDCSVCHDVFPQKTGGIDELKSQGTLQAKDVMNKLCIKCHKDRKRADESHGPTGSCRDCHARPAG
jgi:hypothetical protein